jgi:UDP-glucose 4-epimerase
MRVLVTGGAGDIGSVVTEALLARGHAVVVCDGLVRVTATRCPTHRIVRRGDGAERGGAP